MRCLTLATFIVASLSAGIVSAATDKVVCYHGTWSTYRPGNGKFVVEDIDPNLCTHVIYAFVGINTDGTVRYLDEYLDIGTNNFKRLNALKKVNPKLKTLLAIGGWNEGSLKYSQVAANPTLRANFVKSALNLVLTHGFDGFDLDWEYPGQRGGAAVDKQNFAALLREFRAEFNKHGLLLTAAVGAISNIDLSYDIPVLSENLDIINIMTYDFHGSWDKVTGINAPLYASSKDVSENQKLLNVDSAINAWISRGADPQKIALGLGTYGQTFTLASTSNTGIGAPITGAGQQGPYTQQSGMLGYNEICESLGKGGWTTVWDDEQKTPYSYKGNQWVGYDNPKSISIKTEYAKAKNLAGVMIWSIETEDFRGVCGPKYPLLNAIKTVLGGTSNEDLDPEEPSNGGNDNNNGGNDNNNGGNDNNNGGNDNNNGGNDNNNGGNDETPINPQRPVDPSDLCTAPEYIRDPEDCSVFYYCLPFNGGFIALKQQCNPGLHFDPVRIGCDYPSIVNCPYA